MTDGWERRPGTLPMSARRPWPRASKIGPVGEDGLGVEGDVGHGDADLAELAAAAAGSTAVN